MQSLSNTVGTGAANARHDTALVQARLRLARRPALLDPARPAYLATIDGDCGPRTQAALRQFQSDQVFVGADGRSSQMVAGATAGLVRPGDLTWQRLVASTPLALADLRVLSGGNTVYLAAPVTDLAAALGAAGAMTFEPRFSGLVQSLQRRIHQACGIAVRVCRDGARRSFQTQYELLMSPRRVTRAGPGESNHNFGQAVDLGFEGLRWLRPDGTPVANEDAWLHQLDPRQTAAGEAAMFWALLRAHGQPLGLHRGPVNDHPHLQAWPDTNVDMANRLADLLTRAGQMRWAGRNQRYQCDLGQGGRLHAVGSAAQIWSGQATLTLAMLTQARSARPAGAALAAVAAPAPARPAAAAAAAALTEADVSAMQAALRADFQAADLQWAQWRAN